MLPSPYQRDFLNPNTFRRLALSIRPNNTIAGNYDFEWDSKNNKVYDLVSATDLTTPPDSWPVWNENTNIASGGANTILIDIPGGGPTRFFAVVEKDPPPLFATGFESDDGGFSANTGAGTPWEYGTPTSNDNPGGSVTSGNGGSTMCWGTGLGSPGFYADPTTDACLASPNIDLSGVAGAELSFAQALDLTPDDSAVVRIIDVSTGDPITFGDFPLSITDESRPLRTGRTPVPSHCRWVRRSVSSDASPEPGAIRTTTWGGISTT